MSTTARKFFVLFCFCHKQVTKIHLPVIAREGSLKSLSQEGRSSEVALEGAFSICSGGLAYGALGDDLLQESSNTRGETDVSL